MKHDYRAPGDTLAGQQNRPSEARIQEIIRDVRELFDHGKQESAPDLIKRLHPFDQGRVLMSLSEAHRQGILTRLAPGGAAPILEYLDSEEVLEISNGFEAFMLAQILDDTSPEVVADLLNDLPHRRSVEILGHMRDIGNITPLLRYPDDSAGGLMTPIFPQIQETTTATDALGQIRIFGPKAQGFGHVYVIDSENKLVGSIGVLSLVLAEPNAMARDITDRGVIAVGAETDQEECARLMEHYDLGQLPVLDQDDRLIGVILGADVVDVIEEEATEDMYKIAGMAGERLPGRLGNSLRRRLPWLFLNLTTAFLAAVVISLYEETIAKVVALAVFLPVVAGQGGIGGTQTVTLVVRSMAMGEVPTYVGHRILARELLLGLINGILMGLVVGLIAYAWKGNFVLGAILSLAMMGNMLVAGLAGAGVPLLLRRLHLDPAVSSAVFVTTFTDVIGFLLLLGLAAVFIDLLL